MWEFFWFTLGVVVYSILISLMDFSKKEKFVKDIRILAFQLIGKAYEDLVAIQTIKYKFLIKDSTMDNEKVKIFLNEDEAFLHKWKNGAVFKLNSAVPPVYRNSLGAKDWQLLMSALDNYYKKAISIRIQNNDEQKEE